MSNTPIRTRKARALAIAAGRTGASALAVNFAGAIPDVVAVGALAAAGLVWTVLKSTAANRTEFRLERFETRPKFPRGRRRG